MKKNLNRKLPGIILGNFETKQNLTHTQTHTHSSLTRELFICPVPTTIASVFHPPADRHLTCVLISCHCGIFDAEQDESKRNRTKTQTESMEIASSDFSHFHRDTHFFKKGKNKTIPFLCADGSSPDPPKRPLSTVSRNMCMYLYITISFSLGETGDEQQQHIFFPPFESVLVFEEKYSSNSMCSSTGS